MAVIYCKDMEAGGSLRSFPSEFRTLIQGKDINQGKDNTNALYVAKDVE